MCGDQGEKYVHCVEEAGEGGGDTGGVEGGVVIEWARRPVVGSGDGSGGDVQEVLVKCRIGRFPARKSFYLLVSWGPTSETNRALFERPRERSICQGSKRHPMSTCERH